jgi:K+-sensing histidine kinase KdpD
MEEKKDKYYSEYKLLKDLAIKINSLASLDEIIQLALESALEIMDLESGSISIWDENTQIVTEEIVSGSLAKSQILQKIEREHLRGLRKDFTVESVYLTIKTGEERESIFSYPIKSEKRTVGAINGFCSKERNSVLEEEFLEAIANQIGLAVGKRDELMHREEEKRIGEKQKEVVKSERLSAILQTSVAINHEINNPLTAVLGNAQLLLSRKEGLDEETEEKLKIIEENALKIMNITQTLMKIIEPVIVEYAGGVKMLDLRKSKKKEE